MKVLALVTFSSSTLSMAQGEIADVAESVANPLIEVGYLEKWVNPVELPSVDAEDDGKILKVISGEWAKGSEPGGGGGVFYVDTQIDQNTGTATLNKTYQEIYDAYTMGKMVICRVVYGDGIYFSFIYLNAIGLGEDGVTYVVNFGVTYSCSSVSDYPTTGNSGGDDMQPT